MLLRPIMVKVNRGIGAGGANTNAHGLNYEVLTDLKNVMCDTHLIPLSKSLFHKEMISRNYRDTEVKPMHGCRQPDEAYLDDENKKLFIIEKKFQQVNGSVCEKIQTGDAKRENFQDMFPSLKVEYVYILSDWFRDNCQSELKYLSRRNIPVFWGSDPEFKTSIKTFMTMKSEPHQPSTQDF